MVKKTNAKSSHVIFLKPLDEHSGDVFHYRLVRMLKRHFFSLCCF